MTIELCIFGICFGFAVWRPEDEPDDEPAQAIGFVQEQDPDDDDAGETKH